MKSVSSSYVRDNWARVMDDALHEPIAVTSHGRARVLIVDAKLSEKLTGILAEAAAEAAAPPRYPWLDHSLPVWERVDALRQRKKQIFLKPMEEWTEEEDEILGESYRAIEDGLR
jgi:hypothetical protein